MGNDGNGRITFRDVALERVARIKRALEHKSLTATGFNEELDSVTCVLDALETAIAELADDFKPKRKGRGPAKSKALVPDQIYNLSKAGLKAHIGKGEQCVLERLIDDKHILINFDGNTVLAKKTHLGTMFE